MRRNKVARVPFGVGAGQTAQEFVDAPPTSVSSAEELNTLRLHEFAVVVCVHNQARVVRPCLRTFHARTPHWVSLVIVDDSSDAYTAQLCHDEAGRMSYVGDRYRRHVEVLRNDVNQKYTRSVNRGFAHAFANGAAWAIALNSDTRVTDGWLVRIAQACLEPKVGIVSPYMSDAALLTLPLAPGASYIEQARRLPHVAPQTRPIAVTPVGACMAVKREVWEQFGPFDEAVSPEGYGEECDLWAKAVKGGWRALVASDAYVYHESHASYGKRDAREREDRAVVAFRAVHGGVLDAQAARLRPVDPLPKLTADVRRIATREQEPRLAFWIPHAQLCGGVLALAYISNALNEMGVHACIACQSDLGGELSRIPLTSAPLRLQGDTPSDWIAAGGFDRGIVCATAWFTGAFVQRLAAAHPGITPACFIQDREDLFVMADGKREYDGPGRGFGPYMELAKRASVVNSVWVGESLARDLGVRASRYIPIGVDLDLFYPSDEKPPETFVRVLAFNRPSTPRRGSKLLEQVYGALHTKYGARIDLATYGEEPVKGVPCTHLGKLPQHDLAALMRRSDVMIEPSSIQGWGMPGQEAMASGVCLVSTPNGGIDNYGTHERNCLIARDAGDLFKQACRAVEDDELRRSIARRAREDVRRFSWENIARAWKEWIVSITGAGGSR